MGGSGHGGITKQKGVRRIVDHHYGAPMHGIIRSLDEVTAARRIIDPELKLAIHHFRITNTDCARVAGNNQAVHSDGNPDTVIVSHSIENLVEVLTLSRP